MAGKFVDLKEAAKMIGVTAEELVEMRSRGDIFGYRDGASWKFKMEEVERVMAERAGSAIGSGAGSAIFAANDEEFDNLISGLSSKIVADRRDDPESILVTEQELGHSAEGTSSTIIGAKGKKSAADSDLQLATEGGSGMGSGKSGGSDKLLEAPGARLKGGEGSDVLGGTHLKGSGGSGTGTGDMPGAKSGSGTGDMPIKSGSGTGDMPKVKKAGGSEVHLGDEMKMADDDLELGSDDALDEEIGLAGSGKKSGTGSDVTLGAGDSGINLKPSDSGLNLDEEPLDLGGSAVESLELPEDDDVIALEEEPADPEEATQLKADDQFMLSASDALMEDESDSGSQVIALEDSEAFDENAATMLRAGEQPAMLADDAFAAANMAGPADPLAAATLSPGMAPAGAGMPMYVQQAELPYSIWNVLSLFAIAMLLAVTGMFMTDVMLNMWSWHGSGSASTSLMDAVINTFGLKG
ncbi:MAG: helix-turn-helix domain-containing protein [Planctomycetales bacterium]|nr:helix-turn-helix domain-containing protein [Planctomycetales bacterium]